MTTQATVWRTAEVEAETMEEAMRAAEVDSAEWAEDAESFGNFKVSFTSWDAKEVA